MNAEIKKLLQLIKNEDLRKKTTYFLENPILDLGFHSIHMEPLNFEECPAGAFQHHSYHGGLVQHTISVTRIALTFCDLIEQIYGGEVDRDIVLAGALLHDVMKCYMYTYSEHGGFRTSLLGEKLDHLSLLVAELYKRGFPLEVIHVAASHHGDVSPVKPRTVEALIVHVADLSDSELSSRILRAAEYLIRQVKGRKHRVTSSGEALEIVKAKSVDGWIGLKRLLDGMDLEL